MSSRIQKLLRRPHCKHNNLTWLENIYGDKINQISPITKVYRSKYVCNLCGKIIYEDRINDHSS